MIDEIVAEVNDTNARAVGAPSREVDGAPFVARG